MPISFTRRSHRLFAIALQIPLLLVCQNVAAQNLSGAIELARAYLPARKAQMSDIKASKHDVRQLEGRFLPQVSFRAGATYADYDNAATRSQGFSSGRDSDGHQLNLTIRQRLLDLRSSKDIEAGLAATDVATAELRELDLSIENRVINVYIDVLRFRALNHLALQNVADAERLENLISTQVQHGRSAQVDGHIATTQLAATRARAAELTGLVRLAETRYQRLVGSPAGQLSYPKALKLPANLAGAVAQVGQQHPTLVAANNRVKATEAQYQASTHATSPTIDLELFGDHGHDVQAIQGRDNAYGVRVVGEWTLYNGGSDLAGRQAAAARLQAATFRADDAGDQVQENIARAWQALVASERQLQQLSIQADADQQVFNSYQKLLKAGRETPLNMFVVQRSRDASRLAKLDLDYRVLQNRYALSLAMGHLGH